MTFITSPLSLHGYLHTIFNNFRLSSKPSLTMNQSLSHSNEALRNCAKVPVRRLNTSSMYLKSKHIPLGKTSLDQVSNSSRKHWQTTRQDWRH